MIWLISASLIWAFSFGLIKGLISGVDPFMLGAIRMAFAFCVALVFLRPRTVDKKSMFFATLSGGVQSGLMYIPYLFSFKFLKAHEVALFTMTTPIFIVAINQLLKKQFESKILLAAFIAVLGGVVVAFKGLESAALIEGILLVQVSNLLFAAGQCLYMKTSPSISPFRLAPFYFGGALFCSTMAAFISYLTGSTIGGYTDQQWLVFLWLGIVASGLGFTLWNLGAKRVSYGALAVATDLKLPLAILVSLIVFGEKAYLLRLSIGSVLLIVAGHIAKR